MLAATSGEAAADQAVGVAVRLASALRLKVRVLLCEDGPPGAGAAPLGGYADAPHHEYPPRLEHLVVRALAGCGSEEAKCVGEILVRRGDPASVLLEQVSLHRSSVLALGWHGALGAGRALVLKRLLEKAGCALLLVRQTDHFRARLKVGRDMDEG
jgi:nucleotide-binding universal stress UspA family protein